MLTLLPPPCPPRKGETNFCVNRYIVPYLFYLNDTTLQTEMYIFAAHCMTGMMKHIVLTLLVCFLTFSIAGCREGKDTAATLTEAEALMYTSPDSALQMLEAIPHPERLTGREQADYALLLTQARSRCRITANSDSLIRIDIGQIVQCRSLAVIVGM